MKFEAGEHLYQIFQSSKESTRNLFRREIMAFWSVTQQLQTFTLPDHTNLRYIEVS